MTQIPFSTLVTEAAKVGFAVAGVCSDDQLDTSALDAYKRWVSHGFAGELHYMTDTSPEALQKKISAPKVSSTKQSVVIFAARYEQSPHPHRPKGFGRVARYAWGKDYHRQIPKKISKIVKSLFSQAEVDHYIFSDATPLLERAFAQKASLGFIGKNSLLITPTLGSFFLLGGVVLPTVISRNSPSQTLSSIIDPPRTIPAASCGSCVRCIESCPTKAIVSPYVVDARRCISYLTIEMRRVLTDEEKEMIGDWLFGCDICQDVCPHNHKTLHTRTAPAPLEELTRKYGSGPLISLKEILSITSDEVFLSRFKGTPLMRAKRTGLIRNAICVAANTGCYELIDEIRDVYQRETHDCIRDAAQWALKKLSRTLCS